MAEEKREFKWESINDKTILQSGEIIKKPNDDLDCSIVVKVDGVNIVLVNLFTGKNYKKTKNELQADNYKRISINNLVYRLLTLKNPMSSIPMYYPKSALNNIVRDYALQICLNVIERRGDTQYLYNDYPAIVVAAKPKFVTHDTDLANNVVISYNHSNKKATDKKKNYWNESFNTFIKNNKLKIGEKNPKAKNCSNIIGNCAEQHAVNDLMLRNPGLKPKNVEFSNAIRPRTGEIRPYCENCCKLFKQLNND